MTVNTVSKEVFFVVVEIYTGLPHELERGIFSNLKLENAEIAGFLFNFCVLLLLHPFSKLLKSQNQQVSVLLKGSYKITIF